MNRLLEASAGTGKTFSIAERFTRLVVGQGVDVRRIVVVTFTEAATAELRHRIRKRLREARATEALQSFDEARISTIHGFCQRVLRQHAFESGSGFHVELLGDVDELLIDVVADFWTRLTFDADPAMLPALDAAGISRDLLLDLAYKAKDPDLPVIPDAPEVDAPSVVEWNAAKDRLRALWKVKEVLRALDACDLARRASASHPVSFPKAGTAGHAEQVRSELWRVNPLEPLPACIEHFRAERLVEGTLSGPVPQHAAFDALEALALVHARLAGPLRAHVQGVKLRLVREVRAWLPATLHERGLRSYDELLRDLRDALRDPARRGELLRAIRADVDLALVDEFQDTDPVQWEIFATIFPDALTLVGDPKQAIYGFRGADVHTYRRAADSVGDTETLGVNYRSDEHLVEALNHLFGREGLTEPFGAPWPRFQPVQAYHPGGEDARPALEIRFLPRDGAKTNKGIIDKTWLLGRLPEVVAADVVAELERGAAPGDCAVLVRSNDQARAVASALRRRGVPTVRRSDDNVLKGEVARELAAVLSAVYEPTSAGRRRTALLTDLLGRSVADLKALDADDDAANRIVARFHAWNALWRDAGPGPMLHALLEDEEVLARALGREGGERDAADLLHLAELLDDAARRLELGPSALLSWLRRGGPGVDPEAAALRLATDDPAVQVVTVHGAKGLEYPYVWCPYLWFGGFVSRKDVAHLEFYDDDDRRVLDLGSDEHAEHLERRRAEQLQEDLRLVYVAVTRARHRCVVYWGPAAYTSALGSLLAGRPDDEDRTRYASDEHLLEALEPLLAHPYVGLTHVTWEDVPTYRWARSEPAPSLRVHRVTRMEPPDRSWRRTSFSGLLRGVQAGDPTPHVDHDPVAPAEALPADGARVPLADLPGGARMGTFLHRVLEVHDFTAPDALRGVLDRELDAAGLDPAHADVLEPALLDALRAPVVDGLRLCDLPRSRRLDELEFAFPLRDDLVTVARLAEAFRHPDAPAGFAEHLERLGFAPVRGLMVGSIDLVFEHGGRYWLADYKSNHLGETWSDYAPDVLEHEMAVARYQLQAHIYAVALHRFLGWRVPGYDFDRRFGGVRYLFLRGMHPDHATGVYAARPSRAFVEHLDGVLGC